jgi:hypothetical protein
LLLQRLVQGDELPQARQLCLAVAGGKVRGKLGNGSLHARVARRRLLQRYLGRVHLTALLEGGGATQVEKGGSGGGWWWKQEGGTAVAVAVAVVVIQFVVEVLVLVVKVKVLVMRRW